MRDYATFKRRQQIELLKVSIQAAAGLGSKDTVNELIDKLTQLMMPSGEAKQRLMSQSGILDEEASKVYRIQPTIKIERKDDFIKELKRILKGK